VNSFAQRVQATITALSAREVAILRAGLLLAPLLLVYLLLVSPLLQARERAREEFAAQLAALREAGTVASVAALTSSCTPSSAIGSAEMALSLLQESAARAGIKLRVERAQGRFVASFEAASADGMLAWTRDLMCAGFDISTLAIAAAAAGASVQGRLETTESPAWR